MNGSKNIGGGPKILPHGGQNSNITAHHSTLQVT